MTNGLKSRWFGGIQQVYQALDYMKERIWKNSEATAVLSSLHNDSPTTMVALLKTLAHLIQGLKMGDRCPEHSHILRGSVRSTQLKNEL